MKKIKFPSSILAGAVAAGLMLHGGVAQAQSTIADVYPNGTNMFQPASALTFTASSPAGVTSVTVGLTVTSLHTQLHQWRDTYLLPSGGSPTSVDHSWLKTHATVANN